MKSIISFTLLVLLCMAGCNGGVTEKHQNSRNKNINVADKIIDIKPGILFGNSLLYIIDDVLIVHEMNPEGRKGIHLFNKNTFEYITSTGFIGRGPGEITSPGRIGIDRRNRVLWVQDHGNKVMWKFPLDSILNNEMFKPKIKLDLNYDSFLERFGFINDSIAIGKSVQIIGGSWVMAMSKLNIYSNVIKKYGYEHPGTYGKISNSLFALSVENNFYVNCYYYCDLMTICDLEGNLKYNIYGPDGLNNKDNINSYYFDVDLFGKNIIASYIGEPGLTFDGNNYRGTSPSKFLVFDMDGNYLKTIETGYKFSRFCVDEENQRIIVSFDNREEQLGYFNIPITWTK